MCPRKLSEEPSSVIKHKLANLWDNYAKAGYENIYRTRITREHREKLGDLFLFSGNGIYLDAGCGTGNMFELIVERIQPKELYAIDWSKEMLKKAKLEAQRLQRNSKTIFKFFLNDIAESLPWPDSFFDGAVSNLVICYLRCGWRKAIENLARVIKPNGYLYIGTLLNRWSFKNVVWKRAPIEFLKNPIKSLKELRYLKYRSVISEISDELKKYGVEFPKREELTEFLEKCRFKEIRTADTYWKGGLVLRAKKNV